MERFEKELSIDVVQKENFKQAIPKGSGTLVLSIAESHACNDLNAILQSEDAISLEKCISDIKKNINSKPSMTIEDAKEALNSENIIADIYYGDKILAKDIPVNPDNPSLIYLPYNGGKIQNELLKVVQKTKNNDDPVSELIMANLILNKPNLSPVEENVLFQIPDDFDAENLGGAALCYAITLVALAYTIIAATSACDEDDLPRDLIRFKDEEITNWGPRLSAKKILEKRRDLLNGRLAGSI